MYKTSYGMASRKAVRLRNNHVSDFERARRQLFREGISASKVYVQEGRESAGDIVEEFIT